MSILRNLHPNGFENAFLVIWLCGTPAVLAQRTILSANFQSDASDTIPTSANFYARSLVPFVNPATEPAKITVTGGAFPDPFGPGNKSVLFYNPNSAAQMALTWTSAFQDDPATFRNGVIEFDVWMDKPLPVPGQPGGKFWSFFDMRIGYGGANRSGVSTVNDVTIWDNMRIQNVNQAEPVENVVDAGAQMSVGLQTTYTDPVPGGLMAPNQSFHVRYEITGTAGSESYVIKLNGTPITWMQDGAMSHPWVPGAPGVNTLSFLTDASSFFAGGAGNVYLDNLVVINNDLPQGIQGDYNQNGKVDAADYVVWRKNNGTTNSLPNDPIGGTIGQPQYDNWRSHFGQTAGSGSGAGVNAAVPEPATLVLLMFAVAFWCPRRGRAA
jgi:hypothetical protein